MVIMPGAEEENERLQYADYWDERYSQTTSENEQVHEWFRSFKDLDEFFNRHLLSVYPFSDNPHILHLGSGDSVSSRSQHLVIIPTDHTGRQYRSI
jgi:hypothetical protein